MLRSLSVAILTGAICASASAQTPELALDNTAAGTTPLDPGGSNLSSSFHRAFVLHTPSTATQLTGLRFGLVSGSVGTSITFHADLQSASSITLNPTGPVLASISEAITLNASPSYFTFDLTGSDYATNHLLADTDYSIAIYTTEADTSVWSFASSTPTASNGFSFAAYRASGDGGSTWFDSPVNQALTVEFIPVPEPISVLGLSAAGLGVCTWFRRTVRRPLM